MGLRFTKMHGLGNDYIYVSLLDQAVADAPALARRMSDRHRGIGSDGLILIAPPDAPGPDGQVADCDLRMIMYNADGSRAQMCGNGIRCVAKLAYERGWARRNPLRVATDAGVLTLALRLEGQQVTAVRVDLGVPVLEPARIPVALPGEQVVNVPLELPASGGSPAQRLLLTAVSVGNPHAVFFAPDLAAVPLADWGPRLENHRLFPQRTNVHFVQVLGHRRLRMITWERGSGATQACGTGAAAVCVAAVLNRLTGREITAELPGGELQLEWEARSGHVFKTGPAVEVFAGDWPG